MCVTCGCATRPATSDDASAAKPVVFEAFAPDGTTLGVKRINPKPNHDSVVKVEQQLLARNDALAQQNRTWFAAHNVLALNMMSAPGSGKTTILESTIEHLQLPVYVIEGDQETVNDARRLRDKARGVVQVNTGTGCHLDASMIRGGLESLKPAGNSLLFVENVGNLVCPSLFDLGEASRIVVHSVTEGEDKPLKYPHMFRTADVVVINKIDLLPHLRFDLDQCIACIQQVNPKADILQVSALTREGLEAWMRWLSGRLPKPDEEALA